MSNDLAISSPVAALATGTGFTEWSTVVTGGVNTDYVRYISPTELRVGINAARALPGIIDVAVVDHGVASAPAEFTFAAAP